MSMVAENPGYVPSSARANARLHVGLRSTNAKRGSRPAACILASDWYHEATSNCSHI